MNSRTSRRQFLKFGVGTMIGSAICSNSSIAAETTDERLLRLGKVGRGRMKLALSVRVAEKFSDKRTSSKTIDELITLATSNGYEALCMRASQAGVQTPAKTIQLMSEQIHKAGLEVSMVTGDFAVPQNDDRGPDCLRNITPYLDLTEAFHSDLIRVCLKRGEDIKWARRAADEAQERNIRLAHQSHSASLFETVAGASDVLRKVARSNFGLIYEPANWMIAGEPYGKHAIEKLRDYIFNVYVQNHRLNIKGEASVNTWKRGLVRLNHIGVWQQGGVRFEEVFAALQNVQYEGYVTVHQSFEGIISVESAVQESAEYLRRLIA